MTRIEDIIKIICPKLAENENLQLFIRVASENVSKKFFGKSYNQAIAYRACHLFDKFGDKDKLGANLSGDSISSVTEGGLSISFAVPTSDDFWISSGYGKMYRQLVKSLPTMNVNRAGALNVFCG